jgi:PhnB protein
MQVTPYLFLNGQCEAALPFYESALGAEILFMQRFKDAPSESGESMGPPDGIMHASLKIGDSLLFASDGHGKATPYQGFSISLSVKDTTEGRRVFDALSQGGNVTMPFEKAFWTEGFGMLTDRFGVPWMVNVEH